MLITSYQSVLSLDPYHMLVTMRLCELCVIFFPDDTVLKLCINLFPIEETFVNFLMES